MSVHLPVFRLPLQAVPTRFGWQEHSASDRAFDTGLDQRDVFAGVRTCVICGNSSSWDVLRHREWVPPTAKNNPVHEPRNGMIMCPTCHRLFDTYKFYIRFSPEANNINHTDFPPHRKFHGKAIVIDVNDRYAPFIPLFPIHDECRVRGHNPFNNSPSIPAEIVWQDRVPLHDDGTTLNHNAPPIQSIPPPQARLTAEKWTSTVDLPRLTVDRCTSTVER
ncbi:hypothetical protein EDB92DRAFT_2084711 [Lactarius akahatsu]|uniref:HNH nuclease domain-containing protein n=1 Tax=Lactarius akahatsu TaxID=416441 RepID=A0AAD4LJX6_9AGAM|nr:hypothetical protein EDB92DRAFT_2084711 [Lactarius akahatsu]